MELFQYPFNVVFRILGIPTLTGWSPDWDMRFIMWWSIHIMHKLKEGKDLTKLDAVKIAQKRRDGKT